MLCNSQCGKTKNYCTWKKSWNQLTLKELISRKLFLSKNGGRKILWFLHCVIEKIFKLGNRPKVFYKSFPQSAFMRESNLFFLLYIHSTIFCLKNLLFQILWQFCGHCNLSFSWPYFDLAAIFKNFLLNVYLFSITAELQIKEICGFQQYPNECHQIATFLYFLTFYF